VTFNLRAEGDGQVWRITAEDENEVGVERLNLGDAVAVTGRLDIGIEVDKAGNRRISYRMEAHQILFARARSVAKAAAMIHDSQPMSGGAVRPRVG
jgi:hypothetical protein